MTDSRLDIPGPRRGEGDDPPALRVVARDVTAFVAVAEVCGDLDTTTAPGFDGWVRERMAGRTDLVVDLDGVEFLASAGIGVLLGLRQDAARLGLRLHLTGRRNRVVCRPIQVLGLLPLLDLRDDADVVVAELAPAR